MMIFDIGALLSYGVLACGMLQLADGFVIPSAADVKLPQGQGIESQDNTHGRLESQGNTYGILESQDNTQGNKDQSQKTVTLLQVNGNGKMGVMDKVVERSILLSKFMDKNTVVSEEGLKDSGIHDVDAGHVKNSDMLALIQRMVPEDKASVTTKSAQEGNHRYRRSHRDHETVQRFGRHTLCRDVNSKAAFLNVMFDKLCGVHHEFVIDLVIKLCDDWDSNLNMWVKELFDIDGDGRISYTEKHSFIERIGY